MAWPAAQGATAYLVRIDGQPAARLGPEARSYAADELEEASEHTFEVQALGEDGLASTVLRASATPLDVTPPSLPDDARLRVEVDETLDLPRGAAGRRPLLTPERATTSASCTTACCAATGEVAVVDAPEIRQAPSA